MYWICEILQYQFKFILFFVFNIIYLMPKEGQYDRNILHVLIGLIKLFVIGSYLFISF
jgi:hypothetical protein